MTKGQQPKDIFDVKRIREIIELMEEHDLSAVDLQQGDEKIKLNRGRYETKLSESDHYLRHW